MSKWAKTSIIAAAYPDRGTGNNQESLGFAFHHQGPTFIINAYCQAATKLVDRDLGQYGVMIFLDQRGLHSPNASSSFYMQKCTTVACLLTE